MSATSSPAPPFPTPPLPAAPSPWRLTLEDFCRSRLALTGLVLLVVIVAGALLAPWISPQDPYDLAQVDLMDTQLPPLSRSDEGRLYLLGTDGQGRDILSAILYGLRTSLLVAGASTAIAFVLGGIIGLASGYFGGRFDAFVMRVVDIQLSFPAILIALILLAVLGRGLDKVVIALVSVQWAVYARTVRSSALVEERKEYVDAARGLALGHRSILLRHLLPNCLPPVLVVATVEVAHAITLEATLSFLGVGAPITEPSLGLLVSNGFEFLFGGEYWISLFPGTALVLAVASINVVADGLRRSLDPRRAR